MQPRTSEVAPNDQRNPSMWMWDLPHGEWSSHRAATPHQKFILFVYSDSPNWKSYIERNILPQIQDHAVILNWSERNQWDKTSWPVQVFEHWGGQKNFNPLAVVFCGLTQVRVIRFYRAFLDFKHGKEALLRQAESQLLELTRLETTSQTPHNAT